MNKPVILAVDDDPEVLQAIARDLRRQYGDRYRIMLSRFGAGGVGDRAAVDLEGRYDRPIFGRSADAADDRGGIFGAGDGGVS